MRRRVVMLTWGHDKGRTASGKGDVLVSRAVIIRALVADGYVVFLDQGSCCPSEQYKNVNPRSAGAFEGKFFFFSKTKIFPSRGTSMRLLGPTGRDHESIQPNARCWGGGGVNIACCLLPNQCSGWRETREAAMESFQREDSYECLKFSLTRALEGGGAKNALP